MNQIRSPKRKDMFPGRSMNLVADFYGYYILDQKSRVDGQGCINIEMVEATLGRRNLESLKRIFCNNLITQAAYRKQRQMAQATPASTQSTPITQLPAQKQYWFAPVFMAALKNHPLRELAKELVSP